MVSVAGTIPVKIKGGSVLILQATLFAEEGSGHAAADKLSLRNQNIMVR